MKYIKPDVVESYLQTVGMKLGEWNQVAPLSDENENFISYKAPENSHELFNFSRHVFSWLNCGEWKILQIDNSTTMDTDTASVFKSLVSENSNIIDVKKNKSYIFDYQTSNMKDEVIDLKISNIIFAFLLFEWHGYIVSSGSKFNERIGLLDGYVYCLSNNEECLDEASNIFTKFEASPLSSPMWVKELSNQDTH